MVKKRISKLKKILGKLFLIPLSLTMGHGMAKASEALEGSGIKRKQKLNVTENHVAYVKSEVVEVSPGVFTSEGVAASGEKIYFGLEVIDDANRKQWMTYADHVRQMTSSDIGYFCDPRSGIALQTDKNNRYKNDMNKSGFTDEEYNQYVDMLNAKGFSRDSERFKTLNGVAAGVAAFDLNRPNSEVAYISKQPITGRFKFPDLPKKITLKQFNEVYNNLIMSVRYTFEGDTDVVQVRGIFKNPKVIIDGGYDRIAMPLFGFVGRCMNSLFASKSYLMVEPLPAMHNLICKSFAQDQIFVNKPLMVDENGMYDFTPVPVSIKIPDDTNPGFKDSKILIKLNALKKIGLDPLAEKASQVAASVAKAVPVHPPVVKAAPVAPSAVKATPVAPPAVKATSVAPPVVKAAPVAPPVVKGPPAPIKLASIPGIKKPGNK